MVGFLKGNDDKKYADILRKYFTDKDSLFVFSTDFCHWGRHFDYQPFCDFGPKIHSKIEEMDKEGMKLIEDKDADGFRKYLNET